MPKLVLVRHGQSEWNEKNLFTGWVDVKLSAKGQQEAARAGELLKEKKVYPDVLYTSKLSRAIQTANIALEKADRLWIPVNRSWRLNERHYGDLQGKDKAETLKKFGEEKFNTYRRSFDVPPPPIDASSPFSQRVMKDTSTLTQMSCQKLNLWLWSLTDCCHTGKMSLPRTC